MLKKLAQDIVIPNANIIGHNVILTDENGIVIGSVDESIIGTQLDLAIAVAKTGKPQICDGHSTKLVGDAQPGITLPILLARKLVGTVSITGEPREVSNYGFMVKNQVELLLREEIFFKASLLHEHALQHLIQEICIFNPNTSNINLLLSHGNELGYDLSLPRITVIIEPDLTNELRQHTIDNKTSELEIQTIKLNVLSIIKSVFVNPQNISTFMGTDKFVVLPALLNIDEKEVFKKIQKKCSKVIAKLKEKGISASIGIGTIAKEMSELAYSYDMAWRAIMLGKKFENDFMVFNIEEYYLEGLISNINEQICHGYLAKTIGNLQQNPDWPEMSRTIKAWCESGFHPNNASKVLNIHRNTLLYRLNKIEEISNIDLRNFREALKLYIAILLSIVTE